MEDSICYELSPSQDVSYLQCKYTLFKRVINILSSITVSEAVDFDLMQKAFDLVVERNDCLRIQFFKSKGKLMQYFRKSVPATKIRRLKFATKEEQDAFINKTRLKPIKYLKGVVIEPYFIETYDKKNMIFFKVCHLILDVYGINVIYKDLLAVYQALKNGTELPEQPASFEEIVKADIQRGHNPRQEAKDLEFFTNLFYDNPEPFYAGLHGPDNAIWQKKLKQNHRGMKMFFIQNDTEAFRHSIDAELVLSIIEYCKAKNISLSNFLFYACTLTAARLNNNTRVMLPLCLYNCRTTVDEKSTAGSKVQSAAQHVFMNYKATFEENLQEFSDNQLKIYRHVGFSDRAFESLLHKMYRSSQLETYYSLTYSFVPLEKPEDIEFNMYTNGKGALPAYLIQFFDVKTNEIHMAYDVQTKITSGEQVKDFHEKYVHVLRQVVENPQVKLSEIAL